MIIRRMAIITELLKSTEPAVRYKTRVFILEEPRDSKKIRILQNKIKTSQRVLQLLKNRRKNGKIEPVNHVYKKWSGAHWILATLADIGYPKNDKNLRSAIDQLMDTWLNPVYTNMIPCKTPIPAWKDTAVPVIRGRARRCASQQSNALFAALSLGFIDQRTDRLAELLMDWQWPDGGWNCDRRPEAYHSSFWESLIPLRALSLYAKIKQSTKAKRAAKKASELFLRKRLYKKESNGEIMNRHFIKLHYPCYWKYDILFGLKVMAEAGFIKDKRCQDALNMIESKRLGDGGWPAEARFYRSGDTKQSNTDLVDWGGVDKKRYNEWITVDAFYVLKAAGRLKI